MMMLEEIMEQVFLAEKNDDYEMGIKILNEAQVTWPDLKIDICYELGMLYFRKGEYYRALIKLIEAYQIWSSKDIVKFIYEAYVIPNCEQYRKNYKKNKSLLEKYSLLFCEGLPGFDSLGTVVVWQDEESIIYYSCNNFVQFQCEKYYNSLINESNDFFYTNDVSVDDILNVEKANRREGGYCYLSKELYSLNALYLYYETKEFYSFLQVCDNMEAILARNRIVFLIGEKCLRHYFEDLQVPISSDLKFFGSNKIADIITKVMKNRPERLAQIYQNTKDELIEYYRISKKDIVNRVEHGEPRILFITSIYTTALQYHTINLYMAALKRGLKASVIKEKSYVHEVYYAVLLEEMERFKPDMVIIVDHFRFELFESLFPEMIFLSWAQDPLQHIMDKSTPKKLKGNDFVLNHYISWKEFFEVGYDEKKLISAPIPGNQDIYKTYTITEEEREKYGCDICFVSHLGNINEWIEKDLKNYEGEYLKQAVAKMYLNYYNQVIKEECICYSEQEFKIYVEDYFAENFNIVIEDELHDELAKKMYLEYGSPVYRQAMVTWIIEEGYANIKLWGNGWEEDATLEPYAMGTAENGEVLSKILQSSKIVIGNNYACTSAARVWETMFSGGFYMSNYVPEEHDAIDLRKILDDDDFVMFKTKKDLLEKIEFYLNHEEERKEMIRRGREKALEKMTFDALLDRILVELPKRLSQEEEV